MKFSFIFFFAILMCFNIMLIEHFQEIYILVLLVLGIIGMLVLSIVQEIARNNDEDNKKRFVKSEIIKKYFDY